MSRRKASSPSRFLSFVKDRVSTRDSSTIVSFVARGTVPRKQHQSPLSAIYSQSVQASSHTMLFTIRPLPLEVTAHSRSHRQKVLFHRTLVSALPSLPERSTTDLLLSGVFVLLGSQSRTPPAPRPTTTSLSLMTPTLPLLPLSTHPLLQSLFSGSRRSSSPRWTPVHPSGVDSGTRPRGRRRSEWVGPGSRFGFRLGRHLL